MPRPGQSATAEEQAVLAGILVCGGLCIAASHSGATPATPAVKRAVQRPGRLAEVYHWIDGYGGADLAVNPTSAEPVIVLVSLKTPSDVNLRLRRRVQVPARLNALQDAL